MKNIYIQLSLFFTSLLFVSVFPSNASAATMYLSPEAKTLAPGSAIDLSIRANLGNEVVNAVQANITYQAETWEIVSIDSTSSDFPMEANVQKEAGSIKIARGIIGQGISGDVLLAKLTLKAKQGTSGSEPILVSNTSALIRGKDQVNVLSDTKSATYTITGQPVPSTASPSSSSGSTEISDITVSEITHTSAKITWKLTKPGESSVEYGLTDTFGITAKSKTNGTTHEVMLSTPELVPGTTYYFRIKATEASSSSIKLSTTKTFSTKGYEVKIILQNTSGITVPNTVVTILAATGERTATSDENGIATFSDIPPGQQVIVAQLPEKTHSEKITVENTALQDEEQDTPQSFIVRVAGASTSREPSMNMTILFLGIAVVLLLLLPFIIRFLLKRKNDKALPHLDKPSDTHV